MAPAKPQDRESSAELGSPFLITQYHKTTGRPIRRSAGKCRAQAGYVDSGLIEDLSSEDEDCDDSPPPKRRRTRARASTPEPEPPSLDPIIRDEELGEPSDDETDSAQPITLQFNVPLGFHGPLVVKLDKSLLLQNGMQQIAYDLQPEHTAAGAAPSTPEPSQSVAPATMHKTFSDLPPELRNKVYRHLFVGDRTIFFPPTHDLHKSSQFLRTCRLVHSEGCSVLYGENTFSFDRDKHTRGPFWEQTHKEIGYTDIRRFLNMIGPENLAYLRDVTFTLEDASPSATPYLTHEERRYIKDDHLIDCLRILRGAKLRKFTVHFNGRRALLRGDHKFLRYLEHIKADEVEQKSVSHGCWYHPMQPKVAYHVWEDLKEAMTRKKKLYAEQ